MDSGINLIQTNKTFTVPTTKLYQSKSRYKTPQSYPKEKNLQIYLCRLTTYLIYIAFDSSISSRSIESEHSVAAQL